MTEADQRLRNARIVVVGPCASGKSTLVKGLRCAGFDAHVCAQEHSEIPTLWRHGDPDVVVALDVDLPTVRRRRGDDWPESIYLAQRRRLAPARAAAHAVIDTSVVDAESALTIVLDLLGRSPADPVDT